VLTKVDADLAPSAEQSTAQGRFCAAVFIRQGWPQAMSHLPWIDDQAPCQSGFSQLAPNRKTAFRFLGQVWWDPGRPRRSHRMLQQ
jgi:hypothetical protein